MSCNLPTFVCEIYNEVLEAVLVRINTVNESKVPPKEMDYGPLELEQTKNLKNESGGDQIACAFLISGSFTCFFLIRRNFPLSQLF